MDINSKVERTKHMSMCAWIVNELYSHDVKIIFINNTDMTIGAGSVVSLYQTDELISGVNALTGNVILINVDEILRCEALVL